MEKLRACFDSATEGISDSDRAIFSRGEGGMVTPLASEPGEKSAGVETERPRAEESKQALNILWTSGNPDTFFNMLARYSVNSVTKGWWDGVNVILWGATVQLAGTDTRIQTELMEMLKAGVSVEACRDCCENFGVTDTIARIGITIRSLGEPFTEYLKAGEKVITV